jgi:hypothetical protein
LRRNISDTSTDARVELIDWSKHQQADSALHSQGAMLVRSGNLEGFQVPVTTMLEFVEPVRERAMPHPLIFMPQPLANFSITLETARDKRTNGRLAHYTLLLASFFKNEQPSDEMVYKIWERKRRSTVRSTHILILAGLSDSHCRKLLRYATFSQWALFFLIGLRHPSEFISGFRAKSRYPEVWSYLDGRTRKRAAERQCSLESKDCLRGQARALENHTVARTLTKISNALNGRSRN